MNEGRKEGMNVYIYIYTYICKYHVCMTCVRACVWLYFDSHGYACMNPWCVCVYLFGVTEKVPGKEFDL
jgi:hypothetical protein